MQLIFVLALFLPMGWRAILALFGMTAIDSRRDLAVLTLPLALVGVFSIWIAWDGGVYELFIPYMLIVFWVPQIIGLGFFIWCDNEKRLVQERTKEDTKTPKPNSEPLN